MSGVTVFCFFASYLVALGLELSRLMFQSRVRRVAILGFAAAGLLAQTLYQVATGSQDRLPPLSSLHDWLLVLAWILVALYLYLALCYRELALGVFLLPVVLGLILAAWWWVPPGPAPLDHRLWAVLHGGLVLVGSVAVVAASLAGLMYLVQNWRLKHKWRPSLAMVLPNLEILERVNHVALTLGFVLLTLGFGSGLVLALARSGDLGQLLTDATLIAAAIVWAAFGVLLWMQRRAHVRGPKDAALTIVAFVFFMLTIPVMQRLESNAWHRGSVTAPPVPEVRP